VNKTEARARYFVRVSLVRRYSYGDEGEKVLGAHIGTVHRSRDCVYIQGQPVFGRFEGGAMGKGDWLDIDMVDRAIVRIRGSIVNSLPHCRKCWNPP
jgi:hypothetical protein